MPADSNTTLVIAKIEEGWNARRLAVFDELCASDMVDHSVPPGLPQTRDGTKQLAALYWTVKGWFHRFTTETDVTNLRVVHKTGFIKRRTFEMALDKVESVDVNQTILGRILNYGDVTIRGVGEGIETIKTIASPLAFRSSITTR